LTWLRNSGCGERSGRGRRQNVAGNGKAVLYMRVSTDDGRQTTENQVPILRDMAERAGLTITQEYTDNITGSVSDRPAFNEMWKDLEKVKPGTTTLLVYSLDRLSREGALKTLEYLEKLRKLGVGYKFFVENYLNTDNPLNDVFVAFMATIAKIEREKIGQRTKAGMARAKKVGTRSGKAIGRPKVEIDIELAKVMQKTGMPLAEIARELKVPVTTLKTKLNGRWVKKAAPVWSEPVRGLCEGEEGIFVEDPAGEVVIRYDRTTGKPHCLNHQVELELCRYRHMAVTA
jgi:DNA invertase Pin-like site-specific DNA recombinase